MTIVVFTLSMLISLAVPIRAPITTRLMLVITCHLIILAKIYFVASSPLNDTWQYFYNTRGLTWAFGTGFVASLTQVLRDVVDDYFAVSLIFSITTALAVMLIAKIFYRSGVPRSFREVALFYVVVVSGVSFWGSGITKDGIALLAITVFCLAVVELPRIRLVLITLAIVMVLPVRPHISLLMSAGFAIGLGMAKDLPFSARSIVVMVLAIGGTASLPFVLNYAGVAEGAQLTEVQDQLEEYGSRFSDTSSFVDIGSLPAPLRMLSFFTRPVVIEAQSATQMAAAIQNLGITLYLLLGFWRLLKDGGVRYSVYSVLLMTGLAIGLVLSYAASNLGLATRQKWMSLLPVIIAVTEMEWRHTYRKMERAYHKKLWRQAKTVSIVRGD